MAALLSAQRVGDDLFPYDLKYKIYVYKYNRYLVQASSTMLCSLLLSLQTLMELACYQHLRLLICSLFVPKCTPDGGVLQPCRAVCLAAELRCQHSLGLLGILWPINCNILPDSNDPVECFQP